MATDTKIILKRSDVPTAVPNRDYLEFGELAFNYTDETLYYRSYALDGTEIIQPYDFQRIVPVEKGGTGATTTGQAILNLGAAPILSPAFLGTPSLAEAAVQPTIGILSSDAAAQRALATVAYVRAEIADDAPTKTGDGAIGTSWNIGILGNAATATKLSTAKTISQGAASDITFSYTFDGNSDITPNLTINSTRALQIQTALSLVPGTNVQAYDADLKAIAELTGTAGFLKKTAADQWSLDNTTYTPTSRTVTITTGNGIEGGGGAQNLGADTSWTLGLTNTGVLPGGQTTGTYNDNSTSLTPFTVDAKGRITGTGATVLITPSWESIQANTKPTTLGGYGIVDALDVSATGQTKAGSLTASSFIKTSGISSQFLKADGSSDGTSYTPSARTLTIVTGNGITGGVSLQTLVADRSWTLGLTGQAKQLHDLATDGFFVRSTSGTSSIVARSFAVSGTGLSITNADGVSGNPTISLTTSNLTSLRDNVTNGFLARTALNTLTSRNVAVSGTGLSITNADGVSGNPTITSNATSSNDPSTIVSRNSSGGFSAGAITGSSFIVGTGGNSITLSGTATTTSKVLTLPNTTGTVALLSDIPDHTGAIAATITAANGRVLSAITVNSLGHTTSVAFKALTGVDIPSLDTTKITTGTFEAARITDATVTGKTLTGFVAGTSVSTILNSDTILQAFQKLVPNIAAKANTASPVFTGTVTLPTGTASVVPLILPPGTLNTTNAAAGSIQFADGSLSIVDSTLARKTLAYLDSNVASATTATSAGRWTSAKSISNSVTPGSSDIIFDVSLDGSANVSPTLTINPARASQIRSALGLAIGVTGGIQAYDADLAAIAALADNQSPVGIDTGFLRKTGENTWEIDPNVAPIPTEEVTTITGDDVVGSSGIGDRNIVASLTTVNTAPGIYNNSATAITPFTVDAKGRITGTGTAVTVTPAWGSITATPNTLGGYGITNAQVLNANLTSISAFTGTSNGLLRRNNDSTWTLDTTTYVPTTRTLTIAGVTGSGITVTPSTATNLSADRSWSISLSSSNLTQLRDLGTSTGIIVHNGTTGGGMITRSITGSLGLSVTDGNGVSGNPTISLTLGNLTSLRDLSTTGLVVRTGTNSLQARSIAIAAGSTGLSISNGDAVGGNPTLTLSSSTTNVNSSLVARDASGGFSAGSIVGTNFRASQGAPTTDSSTVGYAFGTDGDTGVFSPIVGSNGGFGLYSNSVERLRVINTGVVLSGIPTAPTATPSTNTTQIATTAFVLGQAGSTAPTTNGIAAVGTSLLYARADHVHSTDTSRAPLASPIFTGTPVAPTPLSTDSSTTIATTAYVRTAISSLVNSAPAALDTLAELAAALADDASYATTITTALATKAPLANPLFTGNVGIGMSTTPAAKLEIFGGSTNDSSPEFRISGSSGYIDFHNSGVAGDYNPIVSAGDKTVIFSNGGADTGNLVIAPWSNSASGIKITSTGNVGIGTSSPTARLDIQNGTSEAQIRIGPSTAPGYIFGNTSMHGFYSASGASIQIGRSVATVSIAGVVTAETDSVTGNTPLVAKNANTGNNTTKTTGLLFQGGDTNGTGKNTGLIQCGPSEASYIGSYLAFQTRSADALGERMRITSTGNVGIGTSSPTVKLDVAGGNGTIAGFAGAGSEWQGIVIKPTDSSASVARGAFIDFHNESAVPLSSLHSYHNTNGSSDIILLNTPFGVRTGDRRAERIRITGAGKTLIGGTSTLTTRFGSTTITPNTQILSNTAGGTNLNDSSSTLFGRFSNDADGSKLFFAKTRGTPTAPTAPTAVVNSGDNLGWLSFGGYDSANIVEAARVVAIVDTGTVINATAIAAGKRYKILTIGTSATNWVALGASSAAVGVVFTATSVPPTGDGTAYEEPATGSVPGALVFQTTPLAATAPVERMRINRLGNVGVGTSGPGARLDVVGPTLTLATPSTYAMWIGNTGGGSGDLAFASNSTNAFIQSWGGKPLIINNQGNSVGIGKVPTTALDVNGTVTAVGFSGPLTGDVTGYVSGATFSNDSEYVDNITTRAQTGFWQNDVATKAKGWPIDGSWQHLIACTHNNDGNYYSMQIAGSFNDQEFYGRKTNGSGTTAWSKFITSDTTGAIVVNGTVTASGAILGTTYLSRQNTASEGGELQFCRANDNGTAYVIDVIGSTNSPVLRLLTAPTVNGTANWLTPVTIKGNGNVGIGTTDPASPLTITARTDNNSPINNGLRVVNSGTGLDDNAIIAVATTGATGGDPLISWNIDGVNGWSAGIDNSDSDNFKISNNWNTLRDNTAVTITNNAVIVGQNRGLIIKHGGGVRILWSTVDSPGRYYTPSGGALEGYVDYPLTSMFTDNFGGFLGDPSWGNAIELSLTNVVQRDNLDQATTLSYKGAYKNNITIDSYQNTDGYVGYTVNGTSSVHITTTLGQAQTTGMPATVGWASIIATRETTSSDGVIYLRLRGHTTADTTTYAYSSWTGVFLQGYVG